MTQKNSLPQIDFSTFILSLNSSALVSLGLVEDPVNKSKSKNVVFAKQSIDVIAMLREKTKGNLNNDEAKLIDNILHDLRLIFVNESKKDK